MKNDYTLCKVSLRSFGVVGCFATPFIFGRRRKSFPVKKCGRYPRVIFCQRSDELGRVLCALKGILSVRCGGGVASTIMSAPDGPRDDLPFFLQKLWQMVDDRSTDSLVKWSEVSSFPMGKRSKGEFECFDEMLQHSLTESQSIGRHNAE